MIRFTDVVKTYENGTDALQGISFEIEDGEFVFLVGPSGSGKSTIIKLLTGEVIPTSGRVMVNGFHMSIIAERQIPLVRRTIGTIFQDFRLIPGKTVFDNLALAMHAVGASRKAIQTRIPYVLELVGLEGVEKRFPDELSGGEQQRVAIARALVNNPSTIVADEPTGNLDPARSLELMMLLEKINSMGTTVVVVTHAREIVDQFSKRVIAIDGGMVISDKTGGYYVRPDITKLTEEARQQASASARRRKVLADELGVTLPEQEDAGTASDDYAEPVEEREPEEEQKHVEEAPAGESLAQESVLPPPAPEAPPEPPDPVPQNAPDEEAAAFDPMDDIFAELDILPQLMMESDRKKQGKGRDAE